MRGRKELLLFPPEDIDRLEYRARPKGTLRYQWPANFTRLPIDSAAAAKPVIFAASINLTHPDRAQREALRRCRPLRCTLGPGETLYLPAYWHHEVYSHAAVDSASDTSDAASGQHLNVAVNHWYRNETAPPVSFG